ncbi:MAG: class I SAM-dependent methyltransferase [Polyangiaceae bacterium]
MRYPTRAIAPAHPARLAAHAMRHGLRPAFNRAFRYLEIGCGDAGHILPIAAQFPEAELVGIDLEADAIADGLAVLAESGMTNVTLRRDDICDAHLEGSFDYIVAHGVYSWVAPTVQRRLLERIGELLAPDGVAYVSYNTFPGWGLRGVVRDTMLRSAGQGDDASRLRRGKSAVTRLARLLPQNDHPYTQLLRAELGLLEGKDDGYLLGEYLAPHNEPIYFADMMARAAEHGLAFLAETLPASPDGFLEHALPWEVMGTSLSRVDAEQCLDVACYRQLRGTLLRRAEAVIVDEPDDGLLRAAGWFAAPLCLQTQEAILGAGKPLAFVAPSGAVIQVERPLLKAALWCLHNAWPQGLTGREVVAAGLAALRDRGIELIVDEREIEATVDDLCLLARRRLIELLPWAPEAERRVPDRPYVHVLNRLEAKHRGAMTAPRHDTVLLDPVTAVVAQICDGTHDQRGLLRELEIWRDAGDLPIGDAGAETLAPMLQQSLRSLGELGVMRPAVSANQRLD